MGAQKILIADDDRAALKLLKMSLKSAGYSVIVAVDAHQAMNRAAEEQPDLCILDVHMPAGGGLSVQQRIEHIPSLCATPIIYLTGDKSPQVEDDAENLGAFAVHYKPLDTDRVLQSVRRALIEYQTHSNSHSAGTVR
jgi:CheY-like chemotaxis protein